MAQITKEQVNKLNSKLANNWRFNLKSYLMHQGEKSIVKMIDIDDRHFIRASLYFDESYRTFEKKIEINLNISLWTRAGDMATSDGLGLFRTIPYNKPRKSYADLEKLSAVIDDAYIMDIYNSGNNAQKCIDNILIDKLGAHIYNV